MVVLIPALQFALISTLFAYDPKNQNVGVVNPESGNLSYSTFCSDLKFNKNGSENHCFKDGQSCDYLRIFGDAVSWVKINIKHCLCSSVSCCFFQNNFYRNVNCRPRTNQRKQL